MSVRVAHACSGRSGNGESAADIVAALVAAGLAVRPRDAPADAEVLAIDGCAASCCSLSLEARGVHPRVVFGLHEPGWDGVGQAVELVRERLEQAAPRMPRRRRAVPATPRRSRRAHTADDYLQAIHLLSSPVVDCGAILDDVPALAAHVSRVLGVSRPSAGEMIVRLESAGLVERAAGRGILLTPAGRAAAARVVRRHRILECFLTDFGDYSPAEAHERAALLRDSFDDDLVERINERLGFPERCPHGWPLDATLDRDERRDLRALAVLEPGARARVARIAEHDSDLVAYLVARGLLPGAAVEVVAPLEVVVDGRQHTLAADAAAAVLVV